MSDPTDSGTHASGESEYQFREVSGESSAELRENYLTQNFTIVCQRGFDADPEIASITLAIAQYWADEAEDAVHLMEIPSLLANPEWSNIFRDNPFFEGEESLESQRHDALFGWDRNRDLPGLDGNGLAIVAFAACCPHMTSQEDPPVENYRPYAIARRDADGGVDLEVVGRVLRPEWENRFDVLEWDTAVSPKRRGFWARLFGRE